MKISYTTLLTKLLNKTVTNMENKELLIKVIDDYSLLSPNQKKVLKVFINYSDHIPADNITQLIGFPKQTTYSNIKLLIDQDFLTKEKKRVFIYSLNKDKLHELVANYNKKIAMIKNITSD